MFTLAKSVIYDVLTNMADVNISNDNLSVTFFDTF